MSLHTLQLIRPPSRHGHAAASSDADQSTMRSAFERAGGVLSSHALEQALRRHVDQPLSTLGKWIVKREVVIFHSEQQSMLPLFQFRPHDMSLRPEIAHIVSELVGVFDDDDLALWFTTPNCWLGDALPIDVLDDDAERVIEAARADRFIGRG